MLVSDLDHLETVNENSNIFGGATYCPYTTKGVTSRLNIREGPSTDSDIVGKWYPGDVKYLESRGGLVDNGFRKFSSTDNRWVSTQYITRKNDRCIRD